MLSNWFTKDFNQYLYKRQTKLTLQLGGTVLVELLLVDIISESQRIEESSGGDNTGLVLKGLHRGGGTSLLDGGEGSGGTGGGSEDSELHHLGKNIS